MVSGQRQRRPVALIRSDQQHRTHAQPHGRSGRILVELSRRQNCGRAQRKHNRRRAFGKKFFKMRRQGRVSRVGIVKAEPGNFGVRRPVLLLAAQQGRKHGQHQVGRVLGVKQRIAAPFEAELRAQIVDGLRPPAAHKPRQPLDCPAHARHSLVGPCQPRIHGQHRRVEGGKERQRRKNIACPGNSGHLRHQRPGVVELAQKQQVGSLRPGRRVQQVVIRLSQHGEKKLTQPALGAFAHVVNHFYEDGVLGIDIRANGMKIDAQRANFGLEDRRHGHHRHVPAPFQLERNRNQRIDVSEGADIRKNHAQNEISSIAARPQV